MIIETKKFKDVNRAPYNPRVELKPGMPEYEKLAKSIDKFNQVLPMVFNKRSGVLVGGHQTMTVLENNGVDESQMSIVDLDDSDEKALNIALNKISGLWDTAQLSELLGELSAIPDFDIELTGFDIDEVASLSPAEVVEDDFNVDDALADIDEPITKRGDIILLGRHRLMCGDSTDAGDVERLMDGVKADMVFTDPPYGMNLDCDYSDMDSKFKGSGGGNKYESIIGDNDDFTPELISTIFDNFQYCNEVFLWGADYYAELIKNKNEGSWIVWDKRLDESADKMYGSCFELCWSKSRHKRIMARIKWAGIFGLEQEFDKKRQHPTQKPISLATFILNLYSDMNNIIVDLYLGSGSTLIAAEQTNRICYGCEISELYCDVIVKRWEEFTGQKAIRPKQ